MTAFSVNALQTLSGMLSTTYGIEPQDELSTFDDFRNADSAALAHVCQWQTPDGRIYISIPVTVRKLRPRAYDRERDTKGAFILYQQDDSVQVRSIKFDTTSKVIADNVWILTVEGYHDVLYGLLCQKTVQIDVNNRVAVAIFPPHCS